MEPLPRLRAALVAALAVAALAPLQASAQGGYSTTKVPRHGVELPVPRDYKAIPVQPTEELVILKWEEEPPRRGEEKLLAELLLARIDWHPDPDPDPESEAEPEPDAEGDEQRSRSKPVARETAPPPPITTLERFVDQRLRAWDLGEGQPQEPSEGFECSTYELSRKKKSNGVRGWIWQWRSDERTYAMVGFCGEDDWKDQTRIWTHMATRMRIGEPVDPHRAKWKRFYERRPEFKGAEWRIRVRGDLPDGWDADDTENYIIVYSTKDQALIRTLKRELEAIREAYVERYPPAQEVTAVSTLRVCQDRDEYHSYGGPPRSGGYWNSTAGELVFYDYEDRDGERGSGKANSRIVLYHEAFHQFIYYSVGELPPHSWFNEGTGDYFSGARFNRGGRISKIDVNPWRIGTIQAAVREGRHVPWKDIIRFEQADYYRPDRVSICYAQGWSMIYFLRHAKEVDRNELWSQILPVYFDTLKTAYASEVEALAEIGREKDRVQLEAAGKRAREAAVDRAFDGVDLREIEEAWAKFVLDLKPPR